MKTAEVKDHAVQLGFSFNTAEKKPRKTGNKFCRCIHLLIRSYLVNGSAVDPPAQSFRAGGGPVLLGNFL
jgi:hypothetical protein